MSTSEPGFISPDSFTVATLNTLMDKTRTRTKEVKPQAVRIPSFVETFLSAGINLDAVCIQEAQKTKELHGGKELARQLGFEASYWAEHNQVSRRGEFIGMFGNKVEDPEFFDVGFTKQAVFTVIGETAVCGYHATKELWGNSRSSQASRVLDKMSPFKHAVVGFDSNDLSFGKSHRMYAKAGYRSVFHESGQKRPYTFPTELYRDIMLNSWQKILLPNGLAIDEIYVRGMDVLDVGVLLADTDHVGLYATVKPKLQI